MKQFDVPFFESYTDVDCGPNALKMVLAYFDETHMIPELGELMRQLDSGLTWSKGIARASKLLGFVTEYHSQEEDHSDIPYYQEHTNKEAYKIADQLQADLEELNIPVSDEPLTLQEVLAKLTPTSIPIILLNWYVVRGKEGFSGHFVPIVGYDKEYVYVHNPGPYEPKANLAIPKEVFYDAWMSEGTDQDLIVIGPKESQMYNTSA